MNLTLRLKLLLQRVIITRRVSQSAFFHYYFSFLSKKRLVMSICKIYYFENLDVHFTKFRENLAKSFVACEEILTRFIFIRMMLAWESLTIEKKHRVFVLLNTRLLSLLQDYISLGVSETFLYSFLIQYVISNHRTIVSSTYFNKSVIVETVSCVSQLLKSWQVTRIFPRARIFAYSLCTLLVR